MTQKFCGVVTLTTGTILVGMVYLSPGCFVTRWSESDFIAISKPVQMTGDIYPDRVSLGFSKVCLFSKETPEVDVNKSQIVTITKASNQIEKFYHQCLIYIEKVIDPMVDRDFEQYLKQMYRNLAMVDLPTDPKARFRKMVEANLMDNVPPGTLFS